MDKSGNRATINNINIKYMSYNFENYQENKLTRPRDEAWSNWHSWKDAEVGDKVQGFIRDAFYRPEEKDEDGKIAFGAQRGITLETTDGKLVNVGVKFLSYVLAATDNLRIGDPLTIVLDEVKAPQKKGHNGAKVYKYYGTNLPENAGNKTVKELTDQDLKEGGSAAPVEETHEEVEGESTEDKSF